MTLSKENQWLNLIAQSVFLKMKVFVTVNVIDGFSIFKMVMQTFKTRGILSLPPLSKIFRNGLFRGNEEGPTHCSLADRNV